MTSIYDSFLASADDEQRWTIVQTFWDKLGGSNYQGYSEVEAPDDEPRFRFTVHVDGTELDLSEASFLDVTAFLMTLTYNRLPNFDAAREYLRSEA